MDETRSLFESSSRNWKMIQNELEERGKSKDEHYIVFESTTLFGSTRYKISSSDPEVKRILEENGAKKLKDVEVTMVVGEQPFKSENAYLVMDSGLTVEEVASKLHSSGTGHTFREGINFKIDERTEHGENRIFIIPSGDITLAQRVELHSFLTAENSPVRATYLGVKEPQAEEAGKKRFARR